MNIRLLCFFVLIGLGESVISEDEAFRIYEKERGRKYSNAAERKMRFEIFKKNLKLVNESDSSKIARLKGQVLLGAQTVGKITYQTSLNDFADMSDEEFKRFYLLPFNKMRLGRGAFEKRLLETSNSGQMDGKSRNPSFMDQLKEERLLQSNFGLRDRVDWSQFASPVKNQQKCNSCYAFAATGLLEMWNRKNGRGQIQLSEQELIDCSTENVDCVGGQPSAALDYIIRNQIAYTKDYPYIAKKNSSCRAKKGRLLQAFGRSSYGSFGPGPYASTNFPLYRPGGQNSSGSFGQRSNFQAWNGPRNSQSPRRPSASPNRTSPRRPTPPKPAPRPRANTASPKKQPKNVPSNNGQRYSGVKSYRKLPVNIVGVLKELSKGPVVVAMYVSQQFKFYSSGVFNGDGCESKTQENQANHAIVALGYDLKADPPYILFKNSWGGDWGDKGLFKVAIGQLSNSSKGLCLIAGTSFGVTPNF